MNVSIHIIIVSWALKTSYSPRSFIRAKHLIKVSELFAEVIAANNVCINDVGADKADLLSCETQETPRGAKPVFDLNSEIGYRKVYITASFMNDTVSNCIKNDILL